MTVVHVEQAPSTIPEPSPAVLVPHRRSRFSGGMADQIPAVARTAKKSEERRECNAPYLLGPD